MDLVALAQAGPAAILLVGIAAFIRGDLVAGFIYRREVERGDRQDKTLADIAVILRASQIVVPPDDGKR